MIDKVINTSTRRPPMVASIPIPIVVFHQGVESEVEEPEYAIKTW